MVLCSFYKINCCRIGANVPGCMQQLGGPDKEMRGISGAGKLCRSNGAGMFASAVGARSGMTRAHGTARGLPAAAKRRRPAKRV
jgi:hypothetical protein